MPSKFGGVPVDSGSRFGGVPVDQPAIVSTDTPDSLRSRFWEAKRNGDEKAALATFREMQRTGVTLGHEGPTPQNRLKTTAATQSYGNDLGASLGKGSRKVLRGFIQGLEFADPEYYADPALRQQIDNVLPDNPQFDENLGHTVIGMIGDPVAQAVPFAVVPEVRSVQGAVGLAGLQGYFAGLPTGQNTLENRGLSALAAAPFGAAGYAATRGAANRVASAARGGYNTEAQATIDAAGRLSQRTGLPAPVNAGDLGNPITRQLQDVVFENTPGSGRVREMTRQQNVVIKGVEDLNARFPPTADHPEAIMQRSMQEAQKQAKQEATRLYDIVDVESKAPGVGPLPPAKASAALKQGLAQYPEMLNSIDNSVTRKKLLSLLSGKPVSFSDTREMLSAVRTELAAAQKRQAMGGSGAKDSVLQLGRLQAALEADQVDWAKGVGGKAYQALKDANAHFSQKVAPYRSQAELRKYVARDANPEGMLRTSADGWETASRRMKAMTPEGQDAYRRGLVQQAIAAGKRDDGKLNLLTIMNNLPTGRAGEQIFSAADQEILNDLSRYARAVDRSLNVGNTPLTGKQAAKLIPAVGAGGTTVAAMGTAGLPYVAGGVVLTNLMRRMASSRVLRAFTASNPVEGTLLQKAANRSLPAYGAVSNEYLAPLLMPPRVQTQDRR